MKTLYVDKKSDLTLAMKTLVTAGMRCYRVKAQCGCTQQGNIRNAIIAINGNTLRTMIIKCKKCAKR